MRFINVPDASKWIEERRLSVTPQGDFRPLAEPYTQLHFKSPTQVGRLVAMGKSIWRMLYADQRVLLWVTNWSVWPSSEHLPLAALLRRALGTDQDLARAPACLVEPGEADDGTSLLLCAILFGWDCW